MGERSVVAVVAVGIVLAAILLLPPADAAEEASGAARNLAALRNGLRDLGYSEGRNIKLEYRFADGTPERYPALMAELIASNPA